MVAVVVRVSQRTGDASHLPIRKFEIDVGRNYDGFEDFAFWAKLCQSTWWVPFLESLHCQSRLYLDNSVPFWSS